MFDDIMRFVSPEQNGGPIIAVYSTRVLLRLKCTTSFDSLIFCSSLPGAQDGQGVLFICDPICSGCICSKKKSIIQFFFVLFLMFFKKLPDPVFQKYQWSSKSVHYSADGDELAFCSLAPFLLLSA